jgi:hypothetical protein
VAVAAALSLGAVGGSGLTQVTTAAALPSGPASFVTFTSSPPTVSWSSTQVWGVIGSTYAPAATATSGDPVAITIDADSTAGACSLTAGTVTFEGPGACIIDADDPGNGSYSAAAQEQQSVDVNYAPSCETLAYQQPGLADGDFTLDVAGVATTIYCADMSNSPADYLDLAAGSSVNFSQLGGNWAYTRTGAVSTSYSKVRFYPDTLQVENGDTTFATSTGSNGEHGANAVGWGVASACSQAASFEVDLEGTPFAFAYGMNGFGAAGSNYNGAPMVSLDSTDQAYSATGVNGWCGHAGLHSPNLQVGGYPGLWGSPVDGSGSFKALLSQVDGSGQPMAGQPLSFAQTPGTALDQGTVQTTLSGAASGATPTYRAVGNCSVDQSGLVTLLALGSCTVMASTPASGDAIASAEVADSFPILLSQSIAFTSSDLEPVVGSDYTAGATGGDSGNPVTFSIDAAGTGGCAVEPGSDVVDLHTVGTCIVDAAQAGNSQYAAAEQSQTVTIQAAGTTATVTPGSASVSGQNDTLTGSVAITDPGSDAYGAPSGTVAFQQSPDGSSWNDIPGCATVSLTWPAVPSAGNIGSATCTTAFAAASAGAAGDVLVRIVYSGDADFLTSTSSSADQAVSPAGTSTSISSQPASTVSGNRPSSTPPSR